MREIRIKYHKLTIIGVTTFFSLLSYFYYTLLTQSGIKSFENFIILIPGLFLMIFWVYFIELILLPFIQGKPAIVLNRKGLFVTTIGVRIPLDHISAVEIEDGRYGYTIKIFSKEQNEKVEQIKSPSKWLAFWISDFASNTPFTFKTMFVQGKSNEYILYHKEFKTLLKTNRNNRINFYLKSIINKSYDEKIF